MELKYHKTLTKEKWKKFQFFQQVYMIANEINRAKNWILKDDFDEVDKCYERALELIDLTVSILTNKNLRRELLRFREVFADVYLNKQKDIEINQKLFNVLLLLNKDSYNILYCKT